MKKILFFENSPSLHKAIKILFSDSTHYSVTFVDNTENFETAIKKGIFDLIITHISFLPLPLKGFWSKKNLHHQDILLMHEKSDSIVEYQEEGFINFMEKPFTGLEFKNKVDFLLGVEESAKIENSYAHPDLLHIYAKEAIEKWLKEQAPQYAKEVIREEIMKLIN